MCDLDKRLNRENDLSHYNKGKGIKATRLILGIP